MKNLITYLKTLWSWVSDSQRNDRRHDCRLTVGSPSGFNSKWMLKLVSVLVLIFTIGIGQMWGAETLVYTLTCPKNASNSSYTSNYDVTVNGISWKAPGNQFADGAWRIGGKNTTNTNRTVYSQTAISNDISKIVITHGSKSSGCTVNSVTVKVSTAKNAAGTVKNTFTPSYVNNGTMTITRPDGADWSNCYYTIIYNYKSSSSSSNNYLILSKIEFYEEETVACSTPPTVGSSLSSVSSTVNSITATVPISSIGGCNITENGLVYSTSVATPTVGAANCTKVTTTACGGTAANKTVTISGLTCGTPYYVRGYATNDANTSYTNVTTQSTSACPTYTVTLKDDNSTLQASAGASVTLPSRAGCTGYTFGGWSTTNNTSWTATAPTIINAGGYTPTNNIDLYPVYTKTESGATTDYSKTETFENQGASTTYNSTQTYTAANSNASIAWSMYYGTVSTSSCLTGSKSAHMRWYSSATGNIPNIKTTTAVSGLQTLTFNAAVSNTNIKMKVEKSTDGSNWTAVASNVSMSTSKTEYSYDISGTIGTGYYIRIGVDGTNSTAPSSGNYTFRVDDVKFDYQEGAGSTTYYISEPNCCTELTSVNGEVAWSSAAATVSWDDVASMNSWALKYKKSGAANWTDYSGSFSSANSRRSNSTAISGLDAGETYVFQVSGTYAGSTYCAKAYSFEFSSTVPKITASGTLTGSNYVYGNGPGTVKTFDVSGVGLEAGSLTFSVPTSPAQYFEVSTDNGSSWGSSKTLTISAGTLSATTIKVRLKAGLEVGSYGAHTITISGGGAANNTSVTIAGTVSPACEDPTITGQPTGATYNMNATATALSVSATKNGSGPALSYQWYSNTANNNTTGTPISGATNDTYTPSTSEAGTKYYYCIVSSGACSATSNVAAVTVNTPSITVSETTRAFGDRAVNPTNPYYKMTFTVSGSTLAKDAPITISGASGMFSVDETSISQTSTGAVSTTTVTVTYNPTTTGTHNATLTIASTGATSKTVTLSGTAKYKVTWMSNGAEHHSDLVASGKPTFPSEPSSCDATSTSFYGWATAEWDDKIQSLAGKTVYTEASAMDNVSGHVTYYAVFAKSTGGGSVNDVIDYTAAQAVLSGKNDSQWGNGDITCASGNKYYLYAMGGGAANTYALKWNANGYLYCKSQAVGMGALSSVTIATTADKTINVYTSSTAYTGAPSATSEGSLTATSSGATKEITSGRNFIGLYGGTSGILVKTITITYGTPATYSDYLTNCCEEWSNPTFSYGTYSLTAGGAHTTKTITGSTHGTLSFESSNTGVITVDPSTGEVTPVGAGTAYVIAHWTAAEGYCAKDLNSSTFTVTGNVTVTFDAATNGGSISTSTQSVPYNEATALKSWSTLGGSAPSCKTFDHWNTAADDSGQSYNNGADITATSAVTLYAIYRTNTYTVSDGTMSGVASHSYSANPINCGATLTITCAADASHKDNPTVTATGTHGAITVVSATEVTIANVTSDIEVSISYAAKDVYTITWMANGSEYTTGGPTTSVLEGGKITTLPTTPTSCSATYSNFIGWYPVEAGAESSPTLPASLGTLGDKVVVNSTEPSDNVTYYAVFSDGDPAGWTLVTSADDLNEEDEYTLGSKNSLDNASLYMMSTQASNNRPGVLYTSADFATNVRTFKLVEFSGYGDDRYALHLVTEDLYLWLPSSNNYLRSRSNTDVSDAIWHIEINGSTYAATLTPQGTTTYTIRWNTSGMFSCYTTGQNAVYLYKKGGVGTGYISTCGTNITITNGGQHITSANGIWAQCQDTIFLTGTRMTDTYNSVRVKVDLTSPNTTAGKNKWKIKLSTTSGAGSATYPFDAKGAAITDNDWTGKIAICYTPDAVNAYDTATFTVSVKNNNSPYQEVIHKTFTMYGRSLPDNFVIAVTDGAGNWYAVPADMTGPYSGSGCDAISTYKPFPITVDNTTKPTIASDVPSRAVYTGAARSAITTKPQTISFKSVPLTGSNYYLWGSQSNQTTIQNTTGDAERRKWFLETDDLSKYKVHLSRDLNTHNLAYYSGRVGQYDAAGKKDDIYFLPISGETCTYYHAPEVSGVSLDATNYTIQFPVDRGAAAWQISTDGGDNWSDLTGTTLVGECSPKTTVQAALPLLTYRGQTIDLKVKTVGAVCEEEKTTFTVPNPVITVNGSKPWHLYGITSAAFDDQSQTITLSGIYEGAGAETTVSSNNPEITPSLVAPVQNGDVHVRLQMTALNATEGNHTATLTFNSTGAETKTVELIITMQSLAPQSITKSAYFSGDILCKNSDLSSSSTYAFSLTNPIYSAAGVVGTMSTINATNIYVYDVATGEKINGSSLGRAIDDGSGIVSFTLHNQVGDMVEGKKYRIEWTNTDLTCKNSSGVPYQDVSYTFTYGDCSKPIATLACPVSKTGFTANWIPSGSNSQSLDVYTKIISGGDVITNWDFTTTNPPAAVNTRFDLNPRDGNTLFQWGSYTGGSRRTDQQNYWRISNTSGHNDIYSAAINTAGTYDIVADMRASTAQTVNVVLSRTSAAYTDGYIRVIETFTIAASEYKHIITSVTVSAAEASSGVKVGLVLGGNKLTDIGKFSVIKQGAVSHVSGYPVSLASSINSHEVTGLTAGTTYYYTVSNGSESNEVTVTTRSDDPAIDFSPGKAVLQTDVNGSTSTSISLDGTNLTLCDLTGAITGTNASYFGYDLSGAIYNQTTGSLSGTLVITYNPTTTGNHTATLTIDVVTLDLEGHACPANYGTMATTATSITKNSATANWSQSTTGYLMLAENSRMNDELLMNGGFEDDGLDWDGVPSAMMPSSGSRQTSICTSGAHGGSSKCIIMTGYGQGSYLYPQGVYSGSGVMGAAVYGAKRTLPAGTYTISCWLHNASTSSALQNTNYASDCNVYMGFAVDCPSSMYASARRSLNDPTGTNLNGKGASWFQVTETFTLDEPTTGYIYLCYKTSGPSYFAADDFSLKYTAAGHGNNFTEYPITSATSLALTGLKPHTSYSYYVMNEDGCESNIIDFTTTDSDDPITITADPNPISLTAAIGSTAKQTVVISEENAYSTILLSVADACGGRISISPTSLGAAGGVAVVSFSPLLTDDMGDQGTCTITATTLGGSPTNITVNWLVAAGYDMSTPTLEVTDISNNTMTVEHNIEIGEDSEMRIQLDRELTEDEIEENVGDELFFSKYYEAYSHKKILAVYNPTNVTISLKGTYIWRSKKDYSDWNRETGINLVNYGKTPGEIGPQEEIIFYNSQLSYTCEQTKTDMSDWAGTTAQAISYDGDDAFLLVRKVRTGESDYRTPPAVSVEEDGGIPIPLTWRTIVDEDETEWTMLDLIGARAKNNMPDGSGVQGRWSWKNCKTEETEDGDEKGWVGYGYDVNGDAWASNTCNSQPAGYLLSTNRCLLIRRPTVKSGNNAVAVNVSDMNTLGKNAIQSEWMGAHVPTEGDQEAVSCENFSFVGGYDYANYYNAWTPLEEGDYVVGDRNADGSYTVTDLNVPKYWCNKLRVEIIEKQTINGVETENVRLYEDYKVPIVIDNNTTTNTATFFGNPNDLVYTGPTYAGADENAKAEAWRAACAECDIVIRGNAKLQHVSGGVGGFHNMTIYPGAKFDNSARQGFTLNSLQIEALNDNVGYAIINDNGSTITADNILHVKRVDDNYWYPFSLPYDCDVAAIRQQNGKSMGEYWEDWGIKYYDGAARQAAGESAAAGANSKFWKQVPVDGTLHANHAYIIGLFTTEWDGQIKNVYFPPKESTEYTEAGDAAKTTTISKWAAGYDSSDESKTRHYGWNFTASPYISMFGESVGGQGFNNTTNLIMGDIQNDGSYANTDYVYVSVPDGADSKTYTQVRANATTLEPFKGYFVQAKTNGSDGSLTLTYAKDYRTLSAAPARRATAQRERVDADLKVEGNGQFDMAGIVVDDEFTTAYEIGGDLTKMYAAATKPQLYFLGQANEKMAYIAIPDANAEDIPMELYAPKAGQYIISLNKRSSRTNGAESVELLYNGNVMTNLLIDSCTINANNKGVISGYSVRIRRTAQVITSMDLINGEHVTVITNNGQMSITNLPGDAKVFVYDMTGRLMSTGNADGESVVNIDAPQQGVYNVVVQSAAGKTTIRTIVR